MHPPLPMPFARSPGRARRGRARARRGWPRSRPRWPSARRGRRTRPPAAAARRAAALPGPPRRRRRRAGRRRRSCPGPRPCGAGDVERRSPSDAATAPSAPQLTTAVVDVLRERERRRLRRRPRPSAAAASRRFASSARARPSSGGSAPRVALGLAVADDDVAERAVRDEVAAASSPTTTARGSQPLDARALDARRRLVGHDRALAVERQHDGDRRALGLGPGAR